MTALEQLNAYLRRLELRLRLFAASRGAAVVAALALLLTLLLVWIGNRYEFANRIVLPLRILLFVAIAGAIALALAVPLSRLTRRRVTRLAEQQAPGFEQRLLTVTERPDPANPFTELVAEDALRLAKENEPERLSPLRRLLAFAGSGAASVAVLIWLIAAGPGYWGYGAGLLWTGSANNAKRPLYDISVKPGNATIRRRSDQRINAQLLGFSAHSVRLFAKYGSALKWDEAAMQPKSDGSGYQFLFAGLSEPVEYYVQADSALSKHFTISVKDLPAVKRVKVALHYPSGLGLRDEVQDPGGDLRVVEGTQADISILTDRHLDRGQLVLEDGSKFPLSHGDGEWLTARLAVQKDGSYHVAALDGGDTVRISDDYFIEAKKDEPPTVKISRPGHDAHVSPIEEVPVAVEASDDFGIEDLQLHYSVNGGDEKTVPLLKQKGAKEANGSYTLSMEDFKVVPGDLVSFYATARDAGKTSRSAILFATAEPFDFKFSQSQQMGGAGGMGGSMDNNNISERQKQIIAATFNQLSGPGAMPPMGSAFAAGASPSENARFLSDAEGKLGDQAKTMAQRMGSRELSQAGSEFQEFSKLMTQASDQMTQASGQLKPGKWHDALPPEQKALQSLLRAEALFRDIQVAFGQQNGGGGGSMGAQRDLARMFDLELDTSKNQYETGQSDNSGGSGDQQKAIDEAFQKLEALARRQQELAAQNQQQQAFEQRWQEEQLRREAEELRQQMQQMAQNQQQGQQSSQSQSSQSSSSPSSSQSSQSASSGSQSSRANSRSQNARSGQSPDQQRQQEQNAEAMRRAASALQRAEDEMRKAVSDHDATAQQRAASDLQEAEETLRNMLHDQAGTSVADLGKRAQDIANQQRELAERMKQMYGPGSQATRTRNGYEQQATEAGGGEDMPEMNDPNSSRYGWGFRRRNWQPATSGRSATDQEKAIAADKEKLAAQLQQLESQMQKEAESMQGTQPGASTKMRKALSDAEQKELALRMQKDAEWLRQGYGDRNVGMEDNVTAGLDDLTRQLRDLQQALKSGDPSGKAGQNERTEEALSELRGLREQLQRGSEQLQRGDSGQNGGNQESQQARQSGSQQGNNSSAWSPNGGPTDELNRRGVQDAIGQLNWLRTQIDPKDRALGGYIDGALWNLHHLTGAQAGLLDSRIKNDAAVSLERVEMELNKRMAQAQAQGTRTGAPEPAPEKYREAVSEYFKKLSQP